MGLLTDLTGHSIFFDSAPLIYFVEGTFPYAQSLYPIFSKIENGAIRAITSTITFAEILVVPYKLNNIDSLDKYDSFISMSEFFIYDLDMETAKYASKIRAEYGLKTPDAVQWATAVLREADFFLTNDKGFMKINDSRILLLENLI